MTNHISFSLDSTFYDKMPAEKDGDFNDKYGSWWGIDNEGENVCSVNTQRSSNKQSWWEEPFCNVCLQQCDHNYARINPRTHFE